MTTRGFSLIELLIAAAIASLLIGGLTAALAPARAAFETTPAALEMQQRSRIGLEVLASALRSAGVREPVAGDLSISGVHIPPALPATTSGAGNVFFEFEVFSPATAGARGVLDRDQPGPAAAMTLGAGPGCPQTPDVCGFMPGTIAAISDGQGRFDVFEVGATDALGMSLMPTRSLSAGYPTRSQVLEIEAFRFALVPQGDGSTTITRITGAGATQPVVDGVVDVSMTLWGEAAPPRVTWDGTAGWSAYGPQPPSSTFRDGAGEWPDGESCAVGRDATGPRTRLTDLGAAGSLVQLSRAILQDGPWCAAGDRGHYDVDLLRVRRIDLSLRLEVLAATLRGPSRALFNRPGLAASASRWVPDREISMSVALRHHP